MSEKHWTGGCHCQKVRYEVTIDASTGISCNCSICSKRAGLLAFAPASKFKLLSGEDSLTDYQFNKKVIHHLFCSSCGVSSFGRGTMPDGAEMAAVNLRCLDGIDLGEVKINTYDGKNA